MKHIFRQTYLALFFAVCPKSVIAQQQPIPTDIEIYNFLIGGKERAMGSAEACDRYRVEFDELNNEPFQGNYTSYFRKEEGVWVYRGSGSAAYFNVENGILTIKVGRPSPKEKPMTHYRISAASDNQIDMVDELGQLFSYSNCVNELR